MKPQGSNYNQGLMTLKVRKVWNFVLSVFLDFLYIFASFFTNLNQIKVSNLKKKVAIFQIFRDLLKLMQVASLISEIPSQYITFFIIMFSITLSGIQYGWYIDLKNV